MTSTRQDGIERRLTDAFDPVELRVKDQSHLHTGHVGAQDGRGHFDIYIVASAFEGLSPVKRHQLIYGTLGSLLQTDVHAVRIRALTPHEVRSTPPE
jgi:BolA protein